MAPVAPAAPAATATATVNSVVLFPPDYIALEVQTWVASDDPIGWAPVEWQPVVAALRTTIADPTKAAALQPLVDAAFPGLTMKVADMTVKHAPKGTMKTPVVAKHLVTVEVDGDADLALTDDWFEWDFGDDSGTVHGRKIVHPYATVGKYTITLTEQIGGKTYRDVKVADVTDAPPVTLPVAKDITSTAFPSATTPAPDLSDLSALKADTNYGDGKGPKSGAAAFTNGDYIKLGDGSLASWDATAWQPVTP